MARLLLTRHGGRMPQRSTLSFLGEVVGWCITLGLTAVFALGLYLDAHLRCGGTLGGFGESPDIRLDRACMRRESMQVWWAPVVFSVLVVVRIAASVADRRAFTDD